MNNFILSSIVSLSKKINIKKLKVIVDADGQSKRFAFVDFNSNEAAKLGIQAWNNGSMKKYPNRLTVTMFD